jgi:D-galactonate transporter
MIEPRQVIREVGWRLVPFLTLLYFVNFIDRVNVGFAALTMNKAIGLSPLAFGWGAGIFFLGYFLFEVPSNLALHRFGARRWIARIMVSWGIVATAMALVTGPTSFVALRFLLGVAEAGFFPGIILYLTYWFPEAARARIVGAFMTAVPLSSVIGNPLSAFLLGFDGIAGVAGWRWLFIIEGVPALLLGVAVWFYLPDRPAEARFLNAEARDWLTATLAAEQEATTAARRFNLIGALTNPAVLLLAAIYFGLVMSLYGIVLWLPQLAGGFGLSTQQIGFVTAIPYLAAASGMYLFGRHSDARNERRFHLAFAAATAGVALIATPYVGPPVVTLLVLCAAAWGIYAALPVFWAIPAGFLAGTAGAGAIGLINSLGNLGGFVGPYLVGWLRQASGGFAAGLIVLGVGCLGAAATTLLARFEPGPDR